MIEPTRLSAFIASRICHDLVSPVASLSTALDIMNDQSAADMYDQAQGLLDNGARQTQARLKFLRYSFGSMGISEGAADIHEAKEITEGFVASHKPEVSWDIDASDISYGHVRLMMNLVVLAVECLPRGGLISIVLRRDDEGLKISVTAQGPRAKMREDAADALAGTEPEGGWSARTIQPLFTRMLLDEFGATFTKTAKEDVINLTASGV